MLLNPVKGLLPDRDEWAQEMIDETGIKITVTELYATSEEDVVKESASAQSAIQFVEEATNQRSLWGIRRKQGSRKIGSVTQSFAKNFSAFLAGYSGVVEMVKTGDNQYGGLAYGTLSLLLSVRKALECKLSTLLIDAQGCRNEAAV